MARGGGGTSRSGGHVGGGSRSGGRISGGSGRSRSSSSMGGRGFSGGSSRPRSPRPPRPGYAPPPPPPGYYGRRPGYAPPPPRPVRRRSGGCLTNIITSVIILTVLIIVAFTATGSRWSCTSCTSGTGVTRTTEKRDKLNSSNLKLYDKWYIDELGWISYERTLNKGLEEFYDKTGVQPLLYLVEYGDGWTPSEQEEFAQSKYDELFDDECHFLVCYFPCENDNTDLVEGDVYYICGKETEKILDAEGKEIFTANWNYYYEQPNLTIEQFFSRIFSSTGEDLMKGPLHIRYVVIIIVSIVAVVVIVILAINWWKARTRQKNKEQEDLERMLDKPLETFGDQSLNDLKDKYDDNNGSGNQ